MVQAAVTFDFGVDAYVENVSGGVNWYEYLMAQLPDYYQNSKMIQMAMRGVAAIYALIDLESEKLERETAVSTAVDKLTDWEKSLSLSVYGLSLDERRALIRGTLWSYKNTFQEKDLRAVIEEMTGATIAIKKRDVHGSYDFEFLNTYGKPAKMAALDARMKRLLNAGYIWYWGYKYHTWNDAAVMTWERGARHTWEGIKTEVLDT